MYTLYRLLRDMIRSIASQAAPWQIALGTFFGTLLGFMPICPLKYGPCPLGLSVLLIALIINCHLGSLLLFMAACKGLANVLGGPEVMIGDQFSGLAQRSADVPFLYMSLWSHTGYLGRTLMGFACAPLFAMLMLWTTIHFRSKLMAKLLERRKLMTAGKVANKAWIFKIVCWFFGL